MAKRSQIYFMVNEKELEFITALSDSLQIPKCEVVSKAIRYFDERFGKEICADIFEKNRGEVVIRLNRLYLTLPVEDHELLKKYSTEFHVSLGEVAKVSMLYWASMEFIIPTIKTFEERFI